MHYKNIHLFRGAAILGIVGAHTLNVFSWQDQQETYDLFNAIVNQSSIWFFFISGFLFKHLANRYEAKRFFSTKLKNVLMPYAICSLPALLVSVTLFQSNIPEPFIEFSPWLQATLMLLTGSHLAPFWFVPTISLLFLISRLLLAGDRQGWLYKLLPALIVCSLLLGREGIQHLTGWSIYASPLSKATYLLPAYVFGMFCCRHYDAMTAFVARHYVAMTLACLALLAIEVLGLAPALHPIFAWKLLSAPLLAVAFNHLPRRFEATMAQLGSYSFGIFFVHGYVLAAVQFLPDDTLLAEFFDRGNIAIWLIMVALATVLSVLGLSLARRVFKARSRQIVGV